MESFFSTVKSELADRFDTYGGAKIELFDYIEVFYNQRRWHSTLGQISPAAFERRGERRGRGSYGKPPRTRFPTGSTPVVFFNEKRTGNEERSTQRNRPLNRIMAMATAFQTDWVSPAKEITGRDHLAVQAVSEHLYTGLLPGLTNVTDRARCYGFYPWFVWAFDQRSKKKSPDELIRVFRRAECLHTLIGIVHELDEGDEWAHGGGLVGRKTLVAVAKRIVSGDAIRLSKYAKLEPADADRYFKHKLGGLGQYYLGPLKDLEALEGNVQEGLRYTAEWGAELATVYNERVDAKAFFDAVYDDRVDAKVVRALSAFCPCHLRKNKFERDALVKLLFCRGEGHLTLEAGGERRQTLTLLLDHARALQKIKGHYPEPAEFLNSCYTGVLPDSTAWSTPASLAEVRNGWGIYRRHELLAIAVQGLFWAGLSALLDEGGHVDDGPAYAKWFGKRFRRAPGASFASTPFTKQIDTCRRSLPKHQDSQSAEHEVNLGNALLQAQNDKNVEEVVGLSVRILLSLVARGLDESPYGALVVADRFFETYEINLFALRRCAVDTWKPLNGLQWLEWLAASWAIRVHFRVALRKLRYQSQDSFRIVPLDDGYRVREAPRAQWSSPRLAQALRFLCDIGSLDLREDLEERPYVLSSFGVQLVETELGRQ